MYDDANREVAILCNHQRTVPKSFEATFEKLNGRVCCWRVALWVRVCVGVCRHVSLGCRFGAGYAVFGTIQTVLWLTGCVATPHAAEASGEADP